MDENPSKKKLDPIDWNKVGKIYKPESAIEDILKNEVNRLEKGYAKAVDNQEVETEEKAKVGKKK